MLKSTSSQIGNAGNGSPKCIGWNQVSTTAPPARPFPPAYRHCIKARRLPLQREVVTINKCHQQSTEICPQPAPSMRFAG